MPDAWELASIAVRFLTGLGLLGSVGLVLVRMVFRSETEDLHRYIVARAGVLAMLALVATALGYMVTAGALVDGVSGMIDAQFLGMLWNTPVGMALGMRCAGLALLLAGLSCGAFPLAAAGGLLALWSVTGVGHVANTDTPWLRMLLLLHLAAAAFWIGILLPLRHMLNDPGTHALAAMLGTGFGAIAQVAVPALVVAGAVMAWRLLGHPSALITTGYGVTLLVKLGAVAGLLTAGAVNRFRFVPALRTGDRTAARGLRRSIAVETILVCLVLMATAVLTTLAGPARGTGM
ncbi:MAG: CopD family protein [Alphaproteobacteria bacterium]|nr:CopD family protein [Alphaproteobacteria bacterium]